MLRIGLVYITALLIIVFVSIAVFGCGGTAAPQTEEQQFVFLFMSDTQADPQTGDYGAFGPLLAKALNKAHIPSLLILGGDTVNDGADEDEWQDFFQSVGSYFEGISVAAAAGNHDNSKHLAGRFTWPDTAPERPDQGYFYSFDMEGVHFTILDSNIMGAANAEDVAWLEADLSGDAAARADWRVVVCHHPFWPAADIPKDINRAETMRGNFLPLLSEYGVDLLFVGHQNIYSRCMPEQGPVQVMVASGGKTSYTPVERPYLMVTADAPNYVVVTVGADVLEGKAYNVLGKNIDHFYVIKVMPL